MTERAGVLIAGGGVVGTSLAWALATRGVRDVVVVDLDLAGVYASSELNAGGARATWWQPVNIDACRLTLDFFREHADEFGFRQLGYLWLYDDAERWSRALWHRELQNSRGLAVEQLTPGEAHERFPVIDRALDELVGATFSPLDGLVNPNAVRAWYRKRAEALGVTFLNRHYITGVTTVRTSSVLGSKRRVAALDVVAVSNARAGGDAKSDDAVLRILTTHAVPSALGGEELRIECDVVVNCLGAWSPLFAAKIGIADVTEPVRRQIALVDVHSEDRASGVDFENMGMVVDASGLYMHGEGAHVLAAYSNPNEPPGFDFDYDGRDYFESELWPRLAHRFSSFERCGHVRGWSGLYAVTPDCSGIADQVDGFSNLFEAHSFTGRGVMQSWAVGQAMAELIDVGRFETVDLDPLSRRRFIDPNQWVSEELHI